MLKCKRKTYQKNYTQVFIKNNKPYLYVKSYKIKYICYKTMFKVV